MENIFICPNCKRSMKLPLCHCGYNVPYDNGVYQLTGDPYIVKNASAEVKYIGYEDIGEYFSGKSLYDKICTDEIYKKIAQMIQSGILLDLACGDGLYTVPLLMEGVNIIAMDISDKMLSLLHKRAKANNTDMSNLIACRANALDIPLCEGSVDAVIANSMLHLISSPEIVVNEIYRVIKKGGKYITFTDHPRSGILNVNNLTVEEMTENKRYDEMISFFHRRYFEILNSEHHIKGVRHSWKFDREKICSQLFSEKEIYVIQKNNKQTYNINDDFLYRMGGKGYSDQSDVPLDIHKTVFGTVMTEFIEKYGDSAFGTTFTGYENDIELTVYIK